MIRGVPAEAGMNRFDWNMRYPGAHTVPGDKTTEGVGRGPLAPPGAYQVRLTVGEQSQSESFEMVKDPRVEATQEDFDAQFALALRIRDKLSETHDNINKIRSTRSQVSEWATRAEGTGGAGCSFRRSRRAESQAGRGRGGVDTDRVQGSAGQAAHALSS